MSFELINCDIMYSKDYIMRMMEMMAELLAVIIGLIKKGDLQKASQLLDKAYKDALKDDAAFIRQMPINNLSELLHADHHYTSDELKLLSDLFYAEGELLLTQNNKPSALEFFEKSLLLFDFVEQEKATFSLSNEKRHQALLQRIDNLTK